MLDSLADIAPELARLTVEFPYGDVYSRPGLTLQQRQLATVGALAALGNAAPQLRFHIDGALNVGCTPEEILEVLIHVCGCAGFPVALNGISAAREVFQSRADLDFSPVSEPRPEDRFAQGEAVLAQIDNRAGGQIIAALKDIAPDMARYSVEFAYGDLFSRPGLDLKTRELVTVAIFTALGSIAPQLRVHIHSLLNLGGTREEVVEVVTQMAVYAGFPAALNGIAVAREVFAERADRPGDRAAD